MPLTTPSTRHFRSVLLGWIDQESGDELTVQVRGSERFLKELGPLGFRSLDDIVAGSGPAPGPRGARSTSERLSAVLSRTGVGPRKRFRSVLGSP